MYDIQKQTFAQWNSNLEKGMPYWLPNSVLISPLHCSGTYYDFD